MVDIRQQWCPQNHRCPAAMVCPVDAIKQEGYGLPEVDHEICIACGKCAKVCPTGAIVMEDE